MSDITFVTFTYNEERRIERVIARSRGCEVLLNKHSGWVEDAKTASRVRQAVKTPWIYWGYPDEIVDAATLEETRTKAKDCSDNKIHHFGRLTVRDVQVRALSKAYFAQLAGGAPVSKTNLAV